MMARTNTNKLINLLSFLALCLIWGSSFLLMKLGMFRSDGSPVLSAYQVAALRMLFGGLALLPFLSQSFHPWPGRASLGYILLCAFLGSFFPAFLFCLAETRVDSALAGMLNAMTPVCTLLVAVFVFRSPVSLHKWLGIFIGLLGCILLFYSKRKEDSTFHYYAGFALLATVCYGFSVNLVRHKLAHVSSLQIATLGLVFIMPLSLTALVVTGFFRLPLHRPPYLGSVAAAATLGLAGTALATVLFYFLVKRAGVIFSSMVTYGIPFVAIAWGWWFEEAIGWQQLLALFVILIGVYGANSDSLKRLAKKIPGVNRPG
jgi:drug/metabolite transporter (DMT)-like permease